MAGQLSETKTIALIGENISADSEFACMVLRKIWRAQQPIERETGRYHGHDGKGFQEWETRKWNRVYRQAEASGWRFTPRELDEIREGMFKYRKQFRRLTKPPEKLQKGEAA